MRQHQQPRSSYVWESDAYEELDDTQKRLREYAERARRSQQYMESTDSLGDNSVNQFR